MTVEALVPRVRRALGVSSSYDSEEIPDTIRGAIGRLLRDYNFPKSISRAYLGSGAPVRGNATLALNEQSFTLPAGFKREFQLRLYDPNDGTWSNTLRKREGFTLPEPSDVQVTGWYWLEGTKLWIDVPVATDGVGKQLILFYQSMSVSANETWITDDFADAVFYLSVMRGSLDFRKPEVAKDYAGLWMDEQSSLAIYLNELEWGGVVMMQRERSVPTRERYPVS